MTLRVPRLSFWIALATLVPTLMASPAEAYSVRVHIHVANRLIDNLQHNWEQTGSPLILLMGPEDQPASVVQIPNEYAEAILNHPEYFRGGAIGPDNFVFPGLTDPTHSWHFSPFSQCQSLLEAAVEASEIAYALGCFLHGATDNNAHHIVNYFSGETFTFFPVDEVEAGEELHYTLANVVRHMLVEKRFEDAIGDADPSAYEPARLEHRIAVDLVRRVYLDPDNDRGLWQWFTGALVERKNEALYAAHLDGFDPDRQLSMSIEEIREADLTVDFDARVLDAYIEFLRTGGEIGGYRPGEMTPADYLLMLPEFIEDMKRLLHMAGRRGEQWLDDARQDADCLLCTESLALPAYEHLFAPTSSGQSRFDAAIAVKVRELDAITEAYLMTVERLSNRIVEKGFAHLRGADLDYAFEPLTTAIAQVSRFPREELFPGWVNDLIDQFQQLAQLYNGLRQMLDSIYQAIVEEIKAQIMARVRAHLDELITSLAEKHQAAVDYIQMRTAALREELSQRLDEAVLRHAGLDLAPGEDLFANFPSSVLWMNTYNSAVGTLANPEVVFPEEGREFFSAPVSFDASYQLEYNQMHVCSDLRSVFYPCGTTAADMLQGDYRTCAEIDGAMAVNPPIECHQYSAIEFDPDPSAESCRRTRLDALTAQGGTNATGSYTLAYPPSLAGDEGPECFSPAIQGSTWFGDSDLARGDQEGGLRGAQVDWESLMGSGTSPSSAGGCGIAGNATAPISIVLLLGTALLRRRRRK